MGSVIVSSAVYQSEIRRLRLHNPQINPARLAPTGRHFVHGRPTFGVKPRFTVVTVMVSLWSIGRSRDRPRIDFAIAAPPQPLPANTRHAAPIAAPFRQMARPSPTPPRSTCKAPRSLIFNQYIGVCSFAIRHGSFALLTASAALHYETTR